MIAPYNVLSSMHEAMGTGIKLPALLLVFNSIVLYNALPYTASHFDVDSYGYDYVGRHFASTYQLHDAAHPDKTPIQPVGYHFFVGMVYALFGAHSFCIVLMQLLISLMSLFLLVRIANLLFDNATAYVTALLYACNLGVVVYTQLILAEVLLIFFLLLFFERLFTFYKTGSLFILIQSGLVLGCSAIIKPLALCLAPLMVPFFLGRVRVQLQQRLLQGLIFLVSWGLPITSYMTYNYATHGVFCFAPMTTLNIYQCFFSKVIERVEGADTQTVTSTTLAFKGSNVFDDAGWNDARRLFKKYIHTYPHIIVLVWCENVAKTLCGLFSTQLKLMFAPGTRGGDRSFFKAPGSSLVERMYYYCIGGTRLGWLQVLALAEAAWSFIRWMLVVCAFLLLRRRQQFFELCLFMLFIAQCAIVTGIDGCCRYRSAFEPILMMLAAVSIVHCYRVVQATTSPLFTQKGVV